MIEYFIIETSGGRQGPFDLVTLVKKIRSGKVTANTEIHVSGDQGSKPASEYEELAEFFDGSPIQSPDIDLSNNSDLSQGTISPGAYLKEAWSFFGSNQILAVTAGAFVMVSLLLVGILNTILPALLIAILGTVICGSCYFMFMLFALQTVRHHPTDAAFMTDIVNYHLKSVVLAAAFASGVSFGLPAILGATLDPIAFSLIILGVIIFSFFVFTPFILLDDANIGYKEALLTSKNWVKSQGMDTIGAIVGILFVNVLGAIVFFFPIFITLPLTSIALAEIYEQRISKG